jgi:hypothetical protein
MSTTTEISDVWLEEDELILQQWSDISICYKWLHNQAFDKYRYIFLMMTIPVIIISTITGTANFAQQQLPEEYRSTFLMVVGSLNIIVGIISTIMQFIKVNELKEGFNMSTRNWDKYHRNIQLELMKNPQNRTSKSTMLEFAKKEFDRLIDLSPEIPNDVIKKFNIKFKDHTLFKPDICDNLTPTIIYKKKPELEVKIEIDKTLEIKEKFKERNGRYPNDEELKDILNEI